jgi:hypothetical protein
MHTVERQVRLLGGIASTAELRSAGFEDEWIRMSVGYGRIRRIRQGWYATHEVPAESFAAWRIGGRLDCVSAARHHGLWVPSADELHVRIPANCARVRLPSESEPRVVLHWSRRLPQGTRLAVSLTEALATIRRCQPATVFDAVARAANR